MKLQELPLKMFVCKEEGAKELENDFRPGDRIRIFYRPLNSLQKLVFKKSDRSLSGKSRLSLAMNDGNLMEVLAIWRMEKGCWYCKYSSR
jgi:hypothetical protein